MFELYSQRFKCWNGSDLVFALRKDTCDFNSIQASVVEDEYGLKDFKFDDGDVIIDVGSETGGEAVVLATLGKRLDIYAFEPIPENYELLKINIITNDAFGVRPFPVAVGGKVGEIDVYYGSMDCELGRHHHFIGNLGTIPRGDKVRVNLTTLEEIIKEMKLDRVKLVKLDPEGAEVDIIKATPSEVLEKIDWIIGEHHRIKRSELLKLTKGLFDDVPCPYQSDGDLGHFRFRNKKLTNNN